jgi:hypothetical protein
MSQSIPNPLRLLGVARIVAGAALIFAAISNVRDLQLLMMQAGRLFGGDPGSTDAPLRSLLTIIVAALQAIIGLVLVILGARWLPSLRFPATGPTPIDANESKAILESRHATAFDSGPAPIFRPLERMLSDQLADATWWRRELIERGVRFFARAVGVALIITIVCVAVPQIAHKDLLGPFPVAFVGMLLFFGLMYAALTLMLLPSNGPRIESMEIPIAGSGPVLATLTPGDIVESPPRFLNVEPASIGNTIGLLGVGTQLALIAWWKLSPISYPLMATSIIRFAGAIIGGLEFLFIGSKITTTGAALLRTFYYESTLIMVDPARPSVAHAAIARSESRGVAGPRHVVSAVAGPDVVDAVRALRR